MFFWRRVAPQIPEEGLKPTATPGYTRNFRDLNDKMSQGKSFSGYERNPLFLNLAGKGFAEMSGLFHVDFDDDARAIATVDWDRDGDLDVWTTNRTSPQVRLLQNDLEHGNTFIAIRLEGNGTTTNRDAIGARLTLSPKKKPKAKQIRTVRGGDGFLTQSSAWTHFGLGTADDEYALSVRWPGGDIEHYAGLAANRRYLIAQGNNQPAVDPAPTLSLPEPENTKETPHTPQNTKEAPHTPQAGFWVVNQVPFPKLTCEDDQGVTRSSTDFLGRPLLINLWATWCAPCLKELAEFAAHANDLQARGATVLALNVDGLAVEGSAPPAGDPEKVLARIGYTLPRGIARQENLAKIEILIEHLTSRRMPLTIPTSILVDPKGNVAAVYQESLSWEQLSEDLTLLNAPATAQLKRASPRPGRWFADPTQIDREAYLGDYATLFATNGFPEESQRLYQLVRPKEGLRSAQEFYNQAKSASQQGQTEQAMAFYKKAIELDPDYGQALTGLGAMLLMQKRLDEARPLFEKALSLDPNHATALINMSMIDQARGDHEKALERLTKVIQRNPEYAEAHFNLGSLLASMKRHEDAIRHLTKGVELSPKRSAGHLNLASVYMATEQWAKAEASYRSALQLNLRNAFGHIGLGNALMQQGKHAGAATSFRNAILAGARDANTHTRLGMAYLAAGKKTEAVAAFQGALKLDPGYEPARKALQENLLGAE